MPGTGRGKKMVELPWQIVASFVALFGLQLILTHLRKRNCEELIDAEKRIQHQFTMRTYREGLEMGLSDGKNLRKRIKDEDHA
jgi:hypothetical protein